MSSPGRTPTRTLTSDTRVVAPRLAAFLAASLAAFAATLALAPAAPAVPIADRCVLLAQEDSLPGSGSSCWGYVDPANGNEYAILGNQYGTAIFNIVNPTAPYLTGWFPGPASSWREMKTYRNYCYVGTEGGGGIQIIDLANPEAPVLAATYTGNGLSSTHTVTIDTLKARLYTNGANGGMRILSLANPVAPVQLGVYTAAYVHDSYARNDTVWAACIGIGQVRVLRTTNPAAIQQIVAFTTENATAHNCWPTEDRRYLLVTDEVQGGRVTSWDITDLSSPIQVEGYTADPCSDTHNVHVRGNLAYIAHYAAGLQVVDVSDPTRIQRVGYYDTYLDGGLFKGAWGVFPYFPSGTIAVSDIGGGLFLIDLVPNSLIRGAVTDAVTGLPITNARVTSLPGGEVDSTDEVGQYRIWVEDGAHTVIATAYGHDSTSVVQSTMPEGTVTLDIALAPVAGGSLSGTFRGSGGSGIANAFVRVKGTPLADTTGPGGAYAFPAVPNGTYTVLLDTWLCRPESAQAVVSGPGNTTVDFTFEAVALAFNFEDTSATGWVVNADGTDTATEGLWTRVNPRGEVIGVEPEEDHTPFSLKKCWVTQQGGNCQPANYQDVDGGKTTLFSPVMDLSGVADPTIQYFRWYVNSEDSVSGTDVWRAQISSDGGASWVNVESTSVREAAWKEVRFLVAAYVTPTNQVRMRFIAEDAGAESTVEAGLDDFRVWGRAVVAVGDGAGDVAGGATGRFALLPNVPNPFNPRTEVRFEIPREGRVDLAVFALDGRRVRTLASGSLPAGRHALQWDGRDDRGREVASGAYLLLLDAGGERAARKVLLAK